MDVPTLRTKLFVSHCVDPQPDEEQNKYFVEGNQKKGETKRQREKEGERERERGRERERDRERERKREICMC